MKDICFVEVKSELGAGTRGASLGVDALKIASLHYGDYLFGKYKSHEIRDSSRLLYRNPVRTHAKRIRGIEKIFGKLANTVQKKLQANTLPVVVSGDHSSAGGTIAGVKMAFPNKRLGVIWIDAHADLHSPYTTPSGNVHGMPLATALAVDNLDNQRNDLTDGDIQLHWERLKNTGGIRPKIAPGDLIFVGIRDLESPETNYIRDHKVAVHTVQQLREQSVKKKCQEMLAYLSDCEVLYISFDIDSLDARLVPGTGTPVDNGLTFREAELLLQHLLADPRVVCFEMTEINPLLDEKNHTAEQVYPLFKKAVRTLEKHVKKGKAKVRTKGSMEGSGRGAD